MARRTVRCSYCGQRGHNKAGCPKLKAKLAARAEAHPDCAWLANERYNEAQRKKRACTYCGEEGHNRTTCRTMKQDILLLEQKNQAWKFHVRERLEDIGLGPGALFTQRGKRWNKLEKKYEDDEVNDVLYIVLAISQSKEFNIVEKDRQVLRACEPHLIGDIGTHRQFSLPRDIRTGYTSRYIGRHFNIVSSLSPSEVRRSFDPSWVLSSTSWTHKYFQKSLHKHLNKWDQGYDLFSRKSKYTGRFDNQPLHSYWSDETHV